jgi:hypothetical protein
LREVATEWLEGVCGGMASVELSESVVRRAWRDAKGWLHHWLFISAELVGSAAVGYLTQSALAALVWIVGLLLILLMSALVRAPFIQRIEARAFARFLLEQKSMAETPKLSVVGVVCERAIETIPGVHNSPQIPATYVKVGFRALGREAPRCTAYVTMLKRTIGDQTAECELVDPIRLKWSSENGAEVLDLHPAMTRYVDVLSSSARRKVLDFSPDVSRPAKSAGFFQAHGSYTLRVVLLSDAGLSSPAMDVTVQWTGKHSSLAATITPAA